MAVRQPTVSLTSDALIIRIPCLTIQDVLELVEAGRLAHRLGTTRSVQSLKDLLA